MRTRPLSPHWTIYRMSRYSMLTSLANRATGMVMSVGLVVFVYWLLCLARGARAYAHAQELLASGVAKLFYVAVIAAFAYHLAAGIRHLIWDTGRGLEKAQSQRSAWLVVVVAILLALVCGWWAFRAREAGG
jgi:succinate dehydrogenase / fumarate reductase cytochrome b subunit